VIALLDTHSFLWAATDTRRLSARVRKFLEDPTHQVMLSTVSLWEISLKHGMGKLVLKGCTPEDLLTAAEDMGFTISAPTARESIGFHRLPRSGHKDPFDRMLAWQCLCSQWTFITRDKSLQDYQALGLNVLW
jgi:PIN domain nuclease of toxin-antitoxin system